MKKRRRVGPEVTTEVDITGYGQRVLIIEHNEDEQNPLSLMLQNTYLHERPRTMYTVCF
ncbi:MAG: hypothetical protein P0120_15970 [Nitrospira sp.]|nr:hypothetical protein [Nitrospira sp.]